MILAQAADVIPGPTIGQLVAVGVGIACFLAASAGSTLALKYSRWQASRSWVWACATAGLACNVVLLVWRAEQLGWDWPLKHRFDTFVMLAGMVGLVGLWADLRWRWEVTGAAFAPIAGVLQACALTGMADYQVAPGPQPSGVIFLVHVIAFVLAGVCLAVAGVAGGFYLALHRRLKKPSAFLTTGRYPSLEALEQLNLRAAALGFPLLTIGLWLGMLQVWDQPDRIEWLTDAKVICATIVWLMYAVLLHMQHLPTFRGTRVAWLSMLSTLGLLVTFVVSDFLVTKHP